MVEIVTISTIAIIAAIFLVRVNILRKKREHKEAYVQHVISQRNEAYSDLEKVFQRNKVSKAYHSLINLKNALTSQKEDFSKRRQKQSWWTKMTTPGFDEYQHLRAINDIDQNIRLLDSKYQHVRREYENKITSVSRRAALAKGAYREEFYKHRDQSFDKLMMVGLLSATASVPISIALDLNKAGSVYDALRSVNSNYADLGDFDIWMQTLLMPEASLQGLTSLTKGAYFEGLVAEKYQGTLHEHFNHPGTDIYIDGLEYQIKATDSLSYIETVDLDTPVIATSEIASASRAIDSGISNFDLDADIAMALGGSLIDLSDVALDAALSGLGGVGVMATISGVAAATRKYRDTGSLVLATGSGVGATAVGVARTTVNTAELGYKVGKFSVLTVVGGAKMIGRLFAK